MTRASADAASDSESSVLEIEEQTLGEAHTEIGFLLAKKWRLAEHLSQSILEHHDPMQAEHFAKLSATCHIADTYCERAGIGFGGDTPSMEHLKQACERLGKNLKEILSDLHKNLAGEMGKASIFLVKGTG